MITILVYQKNKKAKYSFKRNKKITYSFKRKGIWFWLIAMYCLIRYEEMSVVKE